jgi:hypothetical protein
MSNCGCKSTPCGCKGTATAVATRTSCGCGGSGCHACDSRAYVRPRFFAGQLLTEDDLDLLGEYVVAKNRLHNRALWGPGVVCGLDVRCDPCGPAGKVTVAPGYAIDCCGDDIVVPCLESVDVMELIRELEACALGANCADPCSGTSLSANTTRQNANAPVKTYYLYVRYVEDATDPVAPYATGEPCAGQACEPTRIREGHRYELRATDDNPQFPGIATRALQCIDNLEQATSVASDATVMNRDAQRLASAQASLAQTPSPVFAASDVAALQTATTNLQTALAALPATTTIAARSASTTTSSSTPVDPSAVRTAIEATRVAGSLFARLVITPTAQRPKVDSSATQTQLAAAVQNIPAAVTAASLGTLEAAETTTTLSLTKQFSTLTDPPKTITYADQLWALGAPLDSSLVTQLASAQSRIQSYIGIVTTKPSQTTDCQLLAQAESIQPINATGTITATGVTQLSNAATTTSQVYMRLVLGCLCDAVNPPCLRCDDQAVLLAEICVQNCVVIDVCQLVRRFVITWQSLRYWTDIPNFSLNIDAIGEAIQQFCCGTRAQLGSGCPTTVATKQALAGVPSLALLAPQLQTSSPATTPFAQLTSLLPMLGTTASTTVPGGATTQVDAATQQAIQAAVVAAVASTQMELAALRTQVAQLAAKGA